MSNNQRFNVFGTYISCIEKRSTFENLANRIITNPGYLSFPDTNVVAKAYKDDKLKTILNSSLITFTDGKFTEFYARLKGEKKIKNISGYDLLERLLNSGKSHFFYGLNQQQLNKLEAVISKEHPNANVLGYKSPPFLKLNEIVKSERIKEDIAEINSLKPDFIWIGISSPKQDYLMAHYVNQLDQGIMVGVGAVLLYKAGLVKKGPQWVKNIGMRWLYRFVQEPERVWKKGSIKNILFFVYLVIKHDIFRIKQRDIESNSAG